MTDYDCWHETEEAVSVGAILSIMHKNVETAKIVLRHALELVQDLPYLLLPYGIGIRGHHPPLSDKPAGAKALSRCCYCQNYRTPLTPRKGHRYHG